MNKWLGVGTIIDLASTRPAITQCTGSDNEEYIYSHFGFLIGQIKSELGDIYQTERTEYAFHFPLTAVIHKLDGLGEEK